MATYVALIQFTEQGIRNIKDAQTLRRRRRRKWI